MVGDTVIDLIDFPISEFNIEIILKFLFLYNQQVSVCNLTRTYCDRYLWVSSVLSFLNHESFVQSLISDA